MFEGTERRCWGKRDSAVFVFRLPRVLWLVSLRVSPNCGFFSWPLVW
ncbi:hypothetical protein [Candidatus Ichthyocystis sparus]|nr:hypothetical protein [Candidatus Ichthyocystis sparus]